MLGSPVTVEILFSLTCFQINIKGIPIQVENSLRTLKEVEIIGGRQEENAS